MSTPIEDRVSSLEALTQQQAKQLAALQTSLQSAGPRLTTLEAEYADAVKRFQKAERLVARLRVIIGIIWKSTSTDRSTYLSRLPEDQRAQAAQDLEAVNDLENIDRREDPDEWREPVTP